MNVQNVWYDVKFFFKYQACAVNKNEMKLNMTLFEREKKVASQKGYLSTDF
jgi:hypothetical protein